MDEEIRHAIDERHRRTPKYLVQGEMIVIKADPHNALNIDADRLMVFVEPLLQFKE